MKIISQDSTFLNVWVDSSTVPAWNHPTAVSSLTAEGGRQPRKLCNIFPASLLRLYPLPTFHPAASNLWYQLLCLFPLVSGCCGHFYLPLCDSCYGPYHKISHGEMAGGNALLDEMVSWRTRYYPITNTRALRKNNKGNSGNSSVVLEYPNGRRRYQIRHLITNKLASVQLSYIVTHVNDTEQTP
jgi:hypothetical protein